VPGGWTDHHQREPLVPAAPASGLRSGTSSSGRVDQNLLIKNFFTLPAGFVNTTESSWFHQHLYLQVWFPHSAKNALRPSTVVGSNPSFCDTKRRLTKFRFEHVLSIFDESRNRCFGFGFFSADPKSRSCRLEFSSDFRVKCNLFRNNQTKVFRFRFDLHKIPDEGVFLDVSLQSISLQA